MASNNAVLGVIDNHVHAELVVGALRRAGFGAGALGMLVGMGTHAIPGLEPVLAAGPILSALCATGGDIAVALIGMGVPEIDARQYEGGINAGNVLISVHVEDAAERARATEILEQGGATQIVTVDEESAGGAN